MLAAYRKEGARGVVHKNRGRVPLPNATPETIQLDLWPTVRYEEGRGGPPITQLLAEREGVMSIQAHAKAILVRAGLTSPRHRWQLTTLRFRTVNGLPQEGMLETIGGLFHQVLALCQDRRALAERWGMLALDGTTGAAPYAYSRNRRIPEATWALKEIIERPDVVPMWHGVVAAGPGSG